MATWTKEQIKEKLQTNDAWLIHGLLAIYKFQTADEQATAVTKETNNVGFNKFDADILTDIAEFFLEKNFLSKGQKDIVRKKMVKYAGQLEKLANQS